MESRWLLPTVPAASKPEVRDGREARDIRELARVPMERREPVTLPTPRTEPPTVLVAPLRLEPPSGLSFGTSQLPSALAENVLSMLARGIFSVDSPCRRPLACQSGAACVAKCQVR